MGYSEEKERIKSYVTVGGRVIELLPDKSNEKKYYHELEQLANEKKLAIRYPGYKTKEGKCDYCVYLVDKNGEQPISHVDIMQDLYDKANETNYMYLKKYLEDVARNGKDIDFSNYAHICFDKGFNFQELTGLMFYIAIQEDINYPDVYYQGRKMCFYRYIEAVYCKTHRNHKLEEAVCRASFNGIPKLWDDVGDLYDNISKLQR